MYSIEEVNRFDADRFIEVFGNIVEFCQLCSAAIYSYRPFRNVDHIHQLVCAFIDELPLSGKEGVLRLHPDLAGKVAQSGLLSSESTDEQNAAGLHSLTEQERHILINHNGSYREKFGFPFVICAKQNKKNAILSGIEARVKNDKITEILTGIEEVKKICEIRLKNIIFESSASEPLSTIRSEREAKL
ncbi:2-oxo-4-hydroxy-4-carboxy-5-ureidoimidazoline decarboxylase-like [Tubulanus polymorphus]|uniref:2-oxo-4-hydroxy-4-carboxy-5-ureidoimidazoline decarboxylase-like n=1 Tax=Tubulanus polymorphus TaxID=672921 RepID=UPI003DA2E309